LGRLRRTEWGSRKQTLPARDPQFTAWSHPSTRTSRGLPNRSGFLLLTGLGLCWACPQPFYGAFPLSVCFCFIKVLSIGRYRASLGAEPDKRILTSAWSPSPRVLAGTVRFDTQHPGRLKKLPCDSDEILVILLPRGSLASRCAHHRSATITELRCHPFNRTMDMMSFFCGMT